MAGRRLLDLAHLINACRPVLQRHVVLRRQEYQLYTRTSSLVKAIRRQAHPLASTAKAAAHFSQRSRDTSRDGAERYSSTSDERSPQPEQRGFDEDAVPLGRGTKSRELSSEDRRRLQRGYESQIPAQAAEAPSNEPVHQELTDLSQAHGKDVFYSPPTQAGPVLSELPRAKIPKHTEASQGQQSKGGQINSETFYSAKGSREAGPVPKVEAVPAQEQVPEDINTDVFHSPRIAELLGGGAHGSKQGSHLDLEGATETPVEHTEMSTEKDQDTFNVRSSKQKSVTRPDSDMLEGQRGVSTQSEEGELKRLAADVAEEVQGSALKPEPIRPLDVSSEKAAFQMHESKVPSSRLSRLWHYGGLATGMAFGAVSERLRQATGGGDQAADSSGSSFIMSAANMDRLVAKLSRMRGAALKLGQMISFQDASLLPGPIHEVLQRVQDSADYMPTWQRDKVLAKNLGDDWRDLFASFDDVPMAAASIGQVHGAVLRSTGQRVAVKVQYPGVADSIDSDLNNLSILLTASKLLPKGLYLDKTIANARTELAWECDYKREAECTKKFRSLLADEPAFVVPAILDEASGKEVLTMEYMDGVGVTKTLQRLTQAERDHIGEQILRLCLLELVRFRFMQTDPNWTNFLWDPEKDKIQLLDFGASRAYPEKFVQLYVQLLKAASTRDRARCLELSEQLGYLTGLESVEMKNAHLDSLFILAEPFGGPSTSPSPSPSSSSFPSPSSSQPLSSSSSSSSSAQQSSDLTYDFSNQTITARIRTLIPVMLRTRLTPPPEETYSLHRKLSGAFLLLARLGARVRCQKVWEEVLGRD